MDCTRRQFLSSAAGTAAGLTLPRLALASEATGSGWMLERLGRVSPRAGRDIDASPLSVGFEVLDRKGFEPTRTYAAIAGLGVKWARCQTGWCRCETVKGTYDFAWLDEVVDALLAAGITPWFNLGYGNRLYTPDAPDEFAVGWAPVYSEEALAGWLQFTRHLARHFNGRVRHWEIWNEPNIAGFWQPEKPNPADYARLVAATAPVIREEIPASYLIGAALSGFGHEFLEGCFERGLGGFVDAISYHPYRAVPEEGYERDMERLRASIANHAPGLKLWQGENGCPSVGGPESTGALSQLDWDEARQAKWLLRRILLDLRHGVELTSYYHMVDLVGYRGKTNFKGLLRGDKYSPKPAYFAYQCLCALFDALTQRAELSLELIGQKKVLLQEAHFVRHGQALCAYWFPAELQKPWEPRGLDVELALSDGLALDDPVLVDPLEQEVFRLPPARRDAGRLTFTNLPLRDYPMLIASARAIPLA
ncbi:MAG TPA: beta-galactosidase [Candidatus Hydrogenedentes bacterium]|nr:beta-galactosidase [Candidatus Hydrogenedentota bacterium]